MNLLKTIYSGFGLALLAVSAGQAQTTLYANPNGSGTECTQSAPCDVLGAKQKAATLSNSASGDITIQVAAGNYVLSAGLVFGNGDSGKNGHKIIWKGAGCETLFNGGLGVSGWTMHDAGKNIWKAPVPANFDTRQFWVNGQRATVARTETDQDNSWGSIEYAGSFPNEFWGMTESGFQTSFPIGTYARPNRIEAVMRFNWWRHERCPLSGASGNQGIFQSACGANVWVSEQRNVVWIENAYELLDQEGEWYLNPDNDEVYYKPRSGENMAIAEAWLGNVEEIVKFDGASNIVFDGISIAHSTWRYPSGPQGYTGWQGGFIYTGNYNSSGLGMETPGAVQIFNSSYIEIKNGSIKHTGQGAINIQQYSHHINIEGNVIQDISGHGVQVGHKDNGSLNTHDTYIRHNLITETARDFQDNHGVHISYTKDLWLENNEISFTPYSAVGVGWGWSNAEGWWGGIHMNKNYVHHAMRVSSDGGSFYFMSNYPGSEVRENEFDHYLDPGRKHLGTGYMHGGHLYVEDGASNWTVHNNVSKNTTRWLFTWAPNNINNNIQYNWTDNPASQNSIDGVNGSVIANNTVVTNGNWPAEAQTVMANAGLKGIYAGLSTESCSVPIGPAPAKATITSDKLYGAAPLAVSLNASTSTGENLSYRWDNGSGSFASGSSTLNVNLNVGTHVIRLEVTDDSNNKDTASVTLTAYDPSGTFRIEAESYSEDLGLWNKGNVIGYLDVGNWAKYSDINFSGTPNLITLNYAVDPAQSGQTLEFRLDSPTGQLISSVTLPSTGSWTTFQTIESTVNNATGIHDLYLVPIGGNGLNSGAADLDWFEFSQGEGPVNSTLNFQNNITLGKKTQLVADPDRGVYLSIQGQGKFSISGARILR
jgi:hypothetical protein